MMPQHMMYYVYPLICNTLCYLSLINKEELCYVVLCYSISVIIAYVSSDEMLKGAYVKYIHQENEPAQKISVIIAYVSSEC